MFNFLKLFKKREPEQPVIYVVGGQECPMCGGYGLFSYHSKEKGKYYRCEDCFREISKEQVNEFKKQKH